MVNNTVLCVCVTDGQLHTACVKYNLVHGRSGCISVVCEFSEEIPSQKVP